MFHATGEMGEKVHTQGVMASARLASEGEESHQPCDPVPGWGETLGRSCEHPHHS